MAIGAVAGGAGLERPDQAPYTVEIGHGLVLALAGTRLADQDAGLLRTFLGELRLAREQALLRSLTADST
jgi:hypothetical protein